MGRLIGIDYGEIRIGIAISDRTKLIASALCYIDTRKEDPFLRIAQIIQEEEGEKVIIGLPLNMSGEETQKTQEVKAFAQKLKEVISLEIDFWDEGLSTVKAHQIFHKQKKKPSQNKGKVDALAAQIILQEYLDAHPHLRSKS